VKPGTKTATVGPDGWVTISEHRYLEDIDLSKQTAPLTQFPRVVFPFMTADCIASINPQSTVCCSAQKAAFDVVRCGADQIVDSVFKKNDDMKVKQHIFVHRTLLWNILWPVGVPKPDRSAGEVPATNYARKEPF
jgi:hypothetical protein